MNKTKTEGMWIGRNRLERDKISEIQWTDNGIRILGGGGNQMTLFFSSNCSFIIIVLCELLVRCQLFAQKCLNCREVNIIMLGVTLPLVMYMCLGIFCKWVLLHYHVLQHIILNSCRCCGF